MEGAAFVPSAPPAERSCVMEGTLRAVFGSNMRTDIQPLLCHPCHPCPGEVNPILVASSSACPWWDLLAYLEVIENWFVL